MTAARGSHTVAGAILLCYDGSPEAEHAIAFAAALLPGARALVVTVWKPVAEEALAPAGKPPASDPAEINEEQRRGAMRLAEAGAKKASAAGLQAQAVAAEATGRLWHAVELVAEEHEATLIVCGTRRTGMTSMLPGHLAGALVDHASVAVMVVPSPTAAVERRREAHERHLLRPSPQPGVAV
jgi:nucleotide-binding universal stress UspA family protein